MNIRTSLIALVLFSIIAFWGCNSSQQNENTTDEDSLIVEKSEMEKKDYIEVNKVSQIEPIK